MSEPQTNQTTGSQEVSEKVRPAQASGLKLWIIGYLPAFLGFLHWIGDMFPGEHWYSSGSLLGLMWWLMFSIVVHELAHFGVGRLVGLRSWLISIGDGPAVFQHQFNTFKLILRANPYSGVVYPFILESQLSKTRWKQFAMVLAGPLINLALCIYFTKVALNPNRSLSLYNAPEQLAAVNAYLLLWCLIPFHADVDGIRTPNDALSLLQLATGQNRTTSRPSPGIAQASSRTPIGPSWSWMVNQVEAAGLLTHCREQLSIPQLPIAERVTLLDTFVTCVLMYGAGEFLPEAERYSEELFTLKPDEWTVKGTRGSVLIETGRLEEGVSMLQEVMDKDPSAFDRAISASFLALAELKRNNLDLAAEWLRKSRELDPNCGSVKRIEALLRSATS